MKRDQKRRFMLETEDNKGYKFTSTYLSIKKLIFLGVYHNYYITFGYIFYPTFYKNLDIFDNILLQKEVL